MKKTIQTLVIDDHPLQLRLLKQMLSEQGVDTVCYDNPIAALEQEDLEEFDVIFCDIQMPGIDGIDVLEKLNELHYTKGVILMSALENSILYATSAMCEKFSFEVVGTLDKPFIDEEVFELIDSITNRSCRPKMLKNYVDVGDQEFLFALGDGRIKNYYQPIMEASSCRVIGYEALARWAHPIYGLLSPYYFLPIAERCNLSSELFRTVLGNVIKDIDRFAYDQTISINVEDVELEDPEFASKLIERCQMHEVDPSRLKIEISERSTTSSSATLYKNLLKLRLNGVTVSIDDFGIGFSSLDKLARLPFDELKIDRSLISGLDKDRKKNKIVNAVCGLAKSLGIKIVAEGIETIDTLHAIGKYDIDLYQGFYISKPMPVEAIFVLD